MGIFTISSLFCRRSSRAPEPAAASAAASKALSFNLTDRYGVPDYSSTRIVTLGFPVIHAEGHSEDMQVCAEIIHLTGVCMEEGKWFVSESSSEGKITDRETYTGEVSFSFRGSSGGEYHRHFSTLEETLAAMRDWESQKIEKYFNPEDKDNGLRLLPDQLALLRDGAVFRNAVRGCEVGNPCMHWTDVARRRGLDHILEGMEDTYGVLTSSLPAGARSGDVYRNIPLLHNV